MKKVLLGICKFVNKNGLYALLILGAVIWLGFACTRNVLLYWRDDPVINNRWDSESGSKLEADLLANFEGKLGLVDYNGLMSRVIGQTELNNVIKLNNGYLCDPMDEIPEGYVDWQVESIVGLRDYLSSQGCQLLFTMAPSTIDKYNPQLPAGIEDYGNYDLDMIAAKMSAGGINVLDIREAIHDEGLNQYDLMYRTDHHWNTEGGFFAYTKIAEWIRENTGCEIDEKLLDIDNYEITKYKNWFLGSRGQRTGRLFAGVDDFDLIIPKFETEIYNQYGAGTFEEKMINMEPLSEKNMESEYIYEHVLNRCLGHFWNVNAPNTIRVAVVTDSFGDAVNSYMALSFLEFFYVDAYNNSGLKEIVESNDIDVVVLIYSGHGCVEHPEFYSFDY